MNTSLKTFVIYFIYGSQAVIALNFYPGLTDSTGAGFCLRFHILSFP